MIFSTFPVATVVSLEYASTVQFPAVTICNLNMLKKTQLMSSAYLQPFREEEQTTQAGSTVNYDYVYDFFDPEKQAKEERDLINAMSRVDKSIRRDFGHQIADMLVNCQYQSSSCSALNFTEFYNAVYGNCFTFNKEETAHIISRAGPTSGLRLLLNVEEDEYTSNTHQMGFKMVIHDFEAMPFPADEGLLISPGFATNIAISKLDIKRTEAPYGKCVNYGKKDHYKLNMYSAEFNVGYSDKACQMTCFQREVFQSCGCCHLDFPCYLTTDDGKDLNAQYCSYDSDDIVECLNGVILEFQEDRLGCGDICLPACSETTYTTEVSTASWPSVAAEDVLTILLDRHRSTAGKTVTPDYVRRNVASVTIFFKQLNFEHIETSPAYDWSRLLSDLGGQFGLWLGFSLLTALEFVQLIFDICEHLVHRLANRNLKTQPHNSIISIRDIR